LLKALGLDSDIYCADVSTSDRNGGIPNGTITYDSKVNNVALENVVLQNTTERIIQKEYINRANNFIFKLKGKSGMSVTALESDGFDKPTADGKAKFEQAMSDLNNMLNIDAGSSSYSSADCGGFTYALYPGFLKALYYSPNVALTGKGETYFGIGNWYVPDGREIERLIYYRIHSTITDNALTENAWNNTEASGHDVTGKGLNVFTNNAFSNIKFLSDTGSQITSIGNNDGEGLTYGQINYFESVPKWNHDCSEFAGNDCARDIAHNISPVCRLELIES
jgi:hypothetical protein